MRSYLFFIGAGIDLSSLIVAEGKICWDFYIDCLVVCSDGNLLDALGSAIKVVFLHIHPYICSLIFLLISSGCQEFFWLLIKSRELTVNRKGHICGLTKRGGAGLDPSIILDMMSVVEHVSEQLINKLDSEIAAAEAGEEES